MPISVSRKIQALCDLYDLDLDIEVHRAALTKEQAEEYGLPSTPPKSTELRGNKWKQAMGREQTEIDALLSLKPGALREIAAAVIAHRISRCCGRASSCEMWHDTRRS